MYLKDDMVIREGEVSREMYFIKSGAIQVRLPQLSPASCISPVLWPLSRWRLWCITHGRPWHPSVGHSV